MQRRVNKIQRTAPSPMHPSRLALLLLGHGDTMCHRLVNGCSCGLE